MAAPNPAISRPSAQQAVLVLGMHRSGTAAVSRALSFLGFSQPQILTAAGPSNPRGFWEPEKIVRLNEEMIGSLGWSWDHLPLLTHPMASPEEAEAEILAHLSQEWLDRARQAVRESYRPDAARVVCKDPRMSLFASFWQAAFEAEGYAVQHILAFRDPIDVAESLLKHRDVPRTAALRAWLAYNLRPMAAVNVAATVDYKDIVQAPRKALNGLARRLGVSRLDRAASAELSDFIQRTPASPRDEDGEARLLPALVRETLDLLRAWRKGPNPKLEQRAADLRATLADAQLLFGRTRKLPRLAATAAIYRVKPRTVPQAVGSAEPRSLVLHYHLFKNAGTSVDVVLQGNFGDAWRQVEFKAQRRRSNVHEIEAWLLENPSVKALSSHTAQGPLPELRNLTVRPLLFIRHPIDRIRSAYEFERRQKSETPGSRLAKEADFSGYVRQRLDRQDRQCRNFQTWRLATFVRRLAPERERALEALHTLPFVGLVEDFGGSMERMEAYLRESFPDFRAFGAKANVWREGATLEERIDQARGDLGEELWRELVEANRDDFEVFAGVARRYSLRVEPLLAA